MLFNHGKPWFRDLFFYSATEFASHRHHRILIVKILDFEDPECRHRLRKPYKGFHSMVNEWI